MAYLNQYQPPDETPDHSETDQTLSADGRVVGRSYADLPQPKIRRRNGFLREIVETLLLVVALYTLVNLSTARFVVEGSSMEPNFYTDEFVIVSRLAYILDEPERGDVIVFHYDVENKRDYIKRIVGLPGEVIELRDGRVYVNGLLLEEPYVDEYCRCPDEAWFLQEDEYFVLGDNRNSSQDSHNFGPITREQIIGRAWVRYWPPEDWQIIPHHDYELPDELPPPPPTSTPTPRPTPYPNDRPPEFGAQVPEAIS
ncbi:MAG: signal peptidase I [Chloroflexi bacterium]|nr:signal peptidase I [Chloroflexota bacterium]